MSNETRWAAATGGDGGQDYAARFAQLAASGTDVHGEASLCAALAPVGARVLDAGCGTGRVAIRLAAQGYACVGVDSDASMLAVARETSADVTWLLRDLVHLDEGIGSFDLTRALLSGCPRRGGLSRALGWTPYIYRYLSRHSG
jgi:SAM-dependent methyltransferase